MDEPLLVALIVLGSSLLIAGIIFIVKHYEKVRREALQEIATLMDLEFTSRPESSFLSSLGKSPLFSRGHSKKTSNLMHGTVKEVDIKIFDYRYTTGAGKNSHTHHQTVILFKADRLDLPSFKLSPENIFHKIGKAFGYQDINFDTHPEFSDKYLLKSSEEEFCREVFDAKILDYYQQRPGLSTEGSGSQLLFFRDSKKVSPEQLQDFLKDGMHIYTLFKSRLKYVKRNPEK